jgi:hypothetical protein
MAVAEYGTNQYLALIQRLLHVGISSSNAPALAAMIDADYAETLFDAEFAAYVGAAPPVPPNPGSLDKLIMFYDSTSNSHFRWGTSQESVARALGWLIVTDPAYGADPTGATLSDTAVIAARDAAMSSAVSDLDASGFSRILKTIYFPAGRYLLTSAAALMDGARTNSGVFGYSIAGAPEQTRIVFTPSAANTPLFRNLDRFLFPMVRDIYFFGGAPGTNASNSMHLVELRTVMIHGDLDAVGGREATSAQFSTLGYPPGLPIKTRLSLMNGLTATLSQREVSVTRSSDSTMVVRRSSMAEV